MSTDSPSTTAAWPTLLVGDHVRFLRRGIHSRADLGTDGPVLNLHYGDIHTAKRAHLDGLSFGQFPTLTREQASGLDMLQDGDLVLADASEDLDGVGKAVEISRLGDRSAVAGMHTIAARLDKETFADGFKAYLQHIPDFKVQIARMAVGTKVYGITRTHVAAVSLPVPPISEQRAIAKALSDADALIESLEQLIAKKRLLKQGVMQELLTGTRRLPGFEGEWEPRTLSQLASIRSGGTPSTSQPLFWDGDIPWTTPTDITALSGMKYLCATTRTITELGLASSAAELIPAGSVLMTSRATIGECAINRVPVSTNQGFKSFVPAPSTDGQFLYYLLTTQKQRLISLCGGSTFLEIGKAQLVDYEVVVPPSTDEQVAISAVLSDIDEELEAIGYRLGKARQLKQGMMQQLLTGRIRLT